MKFVGLDIHKRVVQACILDEAGAQQAMRRFDLSVQSLVKFAEEELGADCAVALEATTNTWAVVDIIEPYCARVVVSNPMRTKAIATAKVKTDKVDALVLAQLLRVEYLPPVWQPDAATREERSLASRRSALTRQSIHLKNRLHSVLHQRLIQAPKDLFGKKGRQWLAALELPPIAHGEVDTLLRLLDALVIEQTSLRVEIDRRGFANQNIKLLMTLPGVDVTIAHALVAAIGPIERFDSPERLTAYFGLVPSVRQSAEHCYHGRITKQGNTNARWLLVQAAQAASRHPGPIGLQFAKLARRKNRNVAVVAIARKLAALSWHLLTKREAYRYALPAVVETKLSRLRVSAQCAERKRGPRPGGSLSSLRNRGALATCEVTERRTQRGGAAVRHRRTARRAPHRQRVGTARVRGPAANRRSQTETLKESRSDPSRHECITGKSRVRGTGCGRLTGT